MSKKVKLYKEFEKEIPKNIRYELNEALSFTKKTKREMSLPFCTINGKDNGKVFSGTGMKGTQQHVDLDDCKSTGGEKVGDFHGHPVDDYTIGSVPSEGDQVLTLMDTKKTGRRQISCIATPESKFFHCYIPKRIPDNNKLRNYRKALFNTGDLNDVDPFFRQNSYKDFDHIYYDRRTYQRVVPEPGDIITDAFGKGATRLRGRDIKAIEQGTFCDLIQDYTAPGNQKVGEECRERLRERKFLPFTQAQIEELKKIHKYFFS